MAPGKCTERQGYALLVVLIVVGAAAAAATALMPQRLQQLTSERAEKELRQLDRIRTGFLESVQMESEIPGRETWSVAVSKATGLSRKAIERVDPKFANDSTTARLFLVDPGLDQKLLPFRQSDSGLSGLSTNLLGANGRIIILSTTRRGTALPVTETSITQEQFDALWDWVPDPATLNPPSGWPADWNRKAQSIHVARIPIRSLFAELEVTSLALGFGSGLLPVESIRVDKLITGTSSYWLLKGTLARLSKLSLLGPTINLTVQRDQTIDFSEERTGPTPLAFFPFRGTSTTASVITNEGSLGAAWNGKRVDEAYTGATGPRSPAFSGFSNTNRCLDLSKSSGYVQTTGTLPYRLPKFTLAGWIYPDSISGDPAMAFGISSMMHVGIFQYSGRYYLYGKSRRGGTIYASYPYELKTWHHIALVGDGRYTKLYIDGTLAGYRRRFTFNYGRRSLTTFRLGDTRGYWTERYRGYLDDVLLLDQALTEEQLKMLATGAIQKVCDVPNGS